MAPRNHSSHPEPLDRRHMGLLVVAFIMLTENLGSRTGRQGPDLSNQRASALRSLRLMDTTAEFVRTAVELGGDVINGHRARLVSTADHAASWLVGASQS
jgi:hypothetical protein